MHQLDSCTMCTGDKAYIGLVMIATLMEQDVLEDVCCLMIATAITILLKMAGVNWVDLLMEVATIMVVLATLISSD